MNVSQDVKPKGLRFQIGAIVLCLAVAVLMIVNTQLSGEAMWFWYATTFLHGGKLYSQLHTALQPLFVLETASWMRLFGSRVIVYEIPSLIHAFLLVLGIFLLLRGSEWADWQKAIVLLGTFVFTVLGHSYRFDDYHVVAETLIVYALLILVRLLHVQPQDQRMQTVWPAAALGLVNGLTLVTRVTDGAALVTASCICVLVLLPRRRFLALVTLLLVCAVTLLTVVALTGDTFSAYLTNSLIHAAGSKGGTGSIFAAPFVMIKNTYGMLIGLRLISCCIFAVLVLGFLVARFWKRVLPYVLPIQFVLATVLFFILPFGKRVSVENGLFFEVVVLITTLLMYAIAVVVLVQLIASWRTSSPWERRGILILVPILEWASYSAGAAAEPLTNYYEPVALLLLLIPVLHVLRRQTEWIRPFTLCIFALTTVNGLAVKAKVPYSWQNYHYGAIFQNRVWYRHPVYGEMYIDRDLLQFSERVCADIGAVPGKPGPVLLSLPYPFPNYFCNTPPWHNYVQTFFDTSSRATVEQLIQELTQAPPTWIVYQRQLNIMVGSERLYNHNRPLAQRDLDRLIMQKLATGEWTLVDESSYLRPSYWTNPKDTDWYIIRTASRGTTAFPATGPGQ